MTAALVAPATGAPGPVDGHSRPATAGNAPATAGNAPGSPGTVSATGRLVLRQARLAAGPTAAAATRAAVEEFAGRQRSALALGARAADDLDTWAAEAPADLAASARDLAATARQTTARQTTARETSASEPRVAALSADADRAGRPVPASVHAWHGALHAAAQARAALLGGYHRMLAADRRHLLALADAALDDPDGGADLAAALGRYRTAIDGGTEPATADEHLLSAHLRQAMSPAAATAATTPADGTGWAPPTPADPADATALRLDDPRLDRLPVRASVGLSRGALEMALGSLTVHTGDGALPARVRLNWTLRTVGAQVRYHQRTGDRIRLLATPLTGRLRTLLALTEPGPLPTGALIDALAARLGANADRPSEQASEQARATVAGALHQQLLVPDHGTGTRAPHLLDRAATVLAGDQPEAAALLRTISASLATLNAADPAGHPAARHDLHTAQQRLAALGQLPVRLRAQTRTRLAAGPATPDGYRSALRDLAAVAGLASLFDRLHEARALLLAAFVERFGAGARVPLLRHATDLTTMVGRRALLLDHATAAEFGPADGRLPALLAARRAARLALRTGLAAAWPAGENHPEIPVRLDLAALADAAALPEPMRRLPASYTMVTRPAAGVLVLDEVWPGSPRSAPAGPVLVEDSGSAAFADDDAEPLPVEAFGPEQWLGTRLGHDTDADELVLLHPDGRPVRVVSAAMTRPERLPAPLMLAYWLHGTSRVELDPLAELVGARRETGHTLATPRVYAGSVLLCPRRWYPAGPLPGVDQPAGAGGLAELTAWRARYAVPADVLRVEPEAALDPLPGYPGTPRRAGAPQRLDLTTTLAASTGPGAATPTNAGPQPVAAPGYLTETVVETPGRAVQWLVEYAHDGSGDFTNAALADGQG